MMRRLVTFLGLLFSILVLVLPTQSLAQSGTGSISGLILDQSGGVLPGVSVTVVNTATGVKREVVTNERGRFSVPNLPSGVYDINAVLSGFKPTRRTGVNLAVGEALDVSISLSIGDVTQEVTVVAGVELMSTSQAVSSQVSEVSINSLPLSGRRFEDLALLTPGVVRSGSSIAVAGMQADGSTSFNIDGFDFNSSMFGRSRGGMRPSFQMSQDAIREFQVMANSYSAEFGRVGGGMINAVTKSGTNAFHGSAFYYIKDDALNAKNAFATTKPDDRRQQFGGSLGGPITKNRLFFFINTDNQREYNPVIVSAGSALDNVKNATKQDVINAYNRFYNDPAFDKTMTVDQAWQYFLDGKAFVESQVGNWPRRFDQYSIFPRIDWAANSRLNLSVRYNYQRYDAPNGLISGAVIQRAIENNGDTLVRTHTFATQLNYLLSSSTVLETRFAYALDNQPDDFTTGPTSELRDIQSEVILSDGHTFNFGPLNYVPRFIKENRYQFVQTVTHLRGSHSLKAGLDINVVDQNNIQTRTLRGVYSFTNLVNYAVGGYRTFVQNLGDPAAPQVATDWAGYFQDDWKVGRSLTLNMGLRYDLQTFTQPKTPNPLVPETSRIPVDKNNLGPRLGIAWSPGGQYRNILRGGYGLVYIRTLTVDTEMFLYRNGYLRQLVTFLGPDNAAGSDKYAPVSPTILNTSLKIADLGIPANTVEVDFAEDGRVNGQMHQANVTFERLLTPSLSASVGWIFAKGVHLTGKITENVGGTPVRYRDVAIVNASNVQIGTALQVPDYNAANTRPDPTLGDFFINRSDFNSTYNALAVTLNKRMTKNYQFTVAYTFSKATNDNPQQQGADVSAPYGQRDLMIGPANNDMRHRLVMSALFQQPRWEASSSVVRAIFNGWAISAIVAFESAFPYSPTTSTSLTRIRSGIQLAPLDGPYTLYGRNSARGFGYIQNDIRITREIALTKGVRMELIAEAFNLTNHTNLTGPSGSYYSYSSKATFTNTNGQTVSAERLQVSPSYGTASGAAAARELQLAIRLQF